MERKCSNCFPKDMSVSQIMKCPEFYKLPYGAKPCFEELNKGAGNVSCIRDGLYGKERSSIKNSIFSNPNKT